jgi:hypothetical protein
VAVQWFSPSIQVSSTNKTDCHDIAEILLKLALNTINLTHISPNVGGLIVSRIISIHGNR